ncbi:MAG: dihydroorotase [Pseudomonadales bacterium]
MSVDLIITGGSVVTHDETIQADIAVKDGKIQAIGKREMMPAAEKEIDASGRFVLPGVVDPHCHLGYMDTFENAASETMAAACGGVTTIGTYVLALNDGIIGPFEKFKSDFESKSFVDSFWHLMVIDSLTMSEISQCPDIGITSFKFNMGYKGPHADLLGITATDDGATYKGFSTISKMGDAALAACHTENVDIHLMLRDELIAQGRNDYKVWNDSRPPFVEAECMRRAIYLAGEADCTLYIPHITIAEGVDILAQAHKDGIRVIGETCPQYLTHNNDEPAQIMVDHPGVACVNPPLRDKAANERLWEGIRDGQIQTVGSDLAANTLEATGDNIWEAPMGLGNNSELLLPVLLSEGVNKGRISLQKAVEVSSYNAARIYNLPQKGRLAVGADADIVIVDMEKRVTVTTDTLHSLQDWTVYDGWEFQGWPTHTILRGEVIVENGEPIGENRGKYLPRSEHFQA